MAILTLNSNGGTMEYVQGWTYDSDFRTATRTRVLNQEYGELPKVKNGNLLFVSWVDENGNKITSDTVMGAEDVTIYAKWHYVIRPSDYVDLHENISEKNIINSINGKEYAVVDNKDVVLNETVINPRTLEKIFTQEPYIYPNTKYNENLLYDCERRSISNDLLGYKDVGYARAEAYFIDGYFDFDTQEVITDEESISVNFTINYTKSKGDKINNNNVFDNHSTSFFYNNAFPVLANQGDDNLSTNNFLEVKDGIDKLYMITHKGTAKATAPSKREYCETQILEKSQNNTRIRVKYCFRIWAGWNTDNQKNNKVLCVNNITISTKSNTATTTSTKFSYQDENSKVGRDYQLETNELFQSMGYKLASVTEETTGIYYVLKANGEFDAVNLPDEYVAGTTYYAYEYLPVEERISYKTYQEIANAFDTDRRIITFDLLNPVKMVFDDGDKFVDGVSEMRYLDVDDQFSLYDEHNEYIGEFTVIQCNPVWDGNYHKFITAIIVED